MATSTPSKYYSDKHTKKEKVDMSCDQCSTTAEQILDDIDTAYAYKSRAKDHYCEQGLFSPSPKVVDMLVDAGAIDLKRKSKTHMLAIPKTWNVKDGDLLRRIFCIPCDVKDVHYESRFVVPQEGCDGLTLHCLYNIRRVGIGRSDGYQYVETGMATMRENVRDSQDWDELSPLIRDLFPVCECGK